MRSYSRRSPDRRRYRRDRSPSYSPDRFRSSRNRSNSRERGAYSRRRSRSRSKENKNNDEHTDKNYSKNKHPVESSSRAKNEPKESTDLPVDILNIPLPPGPVESTSKDAADDTQNNEMEEIARDVAKDFNSENMDMEISSGSDDESNEGTPPPPPPSTGS